VNADFVTGFVRKAINFLFVSNPRATSMGLLFGFVCQGFSGLASPIAIKHGIPLESVGIWSWLALGVLVFNFPQLVKREPLGAEVEAALRAIRRATREGQLSKTQSKIMYVSLIQRAVERIPLNRETTEQLRHLEKNSGGEADS
jgi:hypothetical protein